MTIDMIMGDERSISINPECFLRSANNTIGKFRLIAKLAAASDLIYGTDCVNGWLSVIDWHIELCIAAMKARDAERSAALAKGDKRAHNTAANELKRADAKRRKYLKFKEMLRNGGAK